MEVVKPKTARPQTWVHYSIAIVFLITAIVALIEMRVRPPVPGFQDAMDEAIQAQNCEGHAVLARYTGIKPIDLGLQVLVTAFLPGTIGINEAFQVLNLYFLVSFFAIISIWNVEAGRKGNKSALISYPGVWSLLYQTVGGAVIIPCYYIAYMRTASRQRDYFSTTSRTVSTPFARALVPSLIIGYLLPTISLFVPFINIFRRQRMIALWQPCPLFVSALLMVLSRLLPNPQPSKGKGAKYVNRVYVISFVVSVVLHLGTISYVLTSGSPEISISSVFDLRLRAPGSPLVAGLKYIFQLDFWVIFVVSLLWAYLAIYDMRLERKTRVGMLQAAVYLIAGTVLLGPAAVLSATWYWREQLLAKTKKL